LEVRVRRRPYSRRHLHLEKALGTLYAGSWPARAWGLFPRGRRVQALLHQVSAGREPGRPRLRVVFASDLHLGPTTPPALLERAAALAAQARPDLLLLGGDYVFLGATTARVRALARWVESVPAATKLAVLGNHDFWARPERIDEALQAAGVSVLVDEALRLPPPHDDVAVVGLDDPLTRRGMPEPIVDRAAVDEALATAGGAAVTVAVCHSPDGMPAVRGRGVRLFLCGHTHGGHIVLPGYGPVWMPSPHGRLWPWGRHEVDGTTVIVSRGVGGSLVPFRVGAPADVVVVDLLPEG
jgi:predicted MPP superfamily phosphohydrolase